MTVTPSCFYFFPRASSRIFSRHLLISIAILMLRNTISSTKKPSNSLDKRVCQVQDEYMSMDWLSMSQFLFRYSIYFSIHWQPTLLQRQELIVNTQPLEIEEDTLSEKFLELQSNELVQERLIWQHLTRRKINEMNHIPDQDNADWGDD